MSFLQRLMELDPALQKPLSSQINLGLRSCSWLNCKFVWGSQQEGFRKLTRDELRQLTCRLQAAPEVILLNLYGHGIGKSMMQEIAGSISLLDNLQVLAFPGA
jgi:hypothetical protein